MKMILGLCAGLTAALATIPARADDAAGCGSVPLTDMAQALARKNEAVQHAWGRENLTLLPKEAGTDGPVLRAAFPANSFSPGRSPIRGGAGFELHRPAARSACLAYKVRFPEGFDFVKGGKLPGLFGGDDPRGCVADDKVTGFSARLMWRTGGAGELYLYAPGREERCGVSIGRGAWTFVPGRWSTVVERVTANSPGHADGAVEVSIDGRSVVKAEGLTLNLDASGGVDGLLFATFFGGSDESWATPRDQSIDFADFRMSGGH